MRRCLACMGSRDFQVKVRKAGCARRRLPYAYLLLGRESERRIFFGKHAAQVADAVDRASNRHPQGAGSDAERKNPTPLHPRRECVAPLVNLKALTRLQSLFVRTEVTDAGVKDLQEALPNCKIYH